MNKTYKNILVGFVTASLLAGCASDKVEFNGDIQPDNNKNLQPVKTQTDTKLDGITGDETVVDNASDIQDETNTNSIATEEETTQTNSTNSDGINRVQSTVDGQTVVLDSVHFGFDKFNLTDPMREIATANASKIENVKVSYSNVKIKLEGNCDEWGTDEYNYALGLKRAKSAKDALIEDGVDANSIMMVSFGESNPVCNEKTTACWKLNRRVDYRLLP